MFKKPLKKWTFLLIAKTCPWMLMDWHLFQLWYFISVLLSHSSDFMVATEGETVTCGVTLSTILKWLTFLWKVTHVIHTLHTRCGSSTSKCRRRRTGLMYRRRRTLSILLTWSDLEKKVNEETAEESECVIRVSWPALKQYYSGQNPLSSPNKGTEEHCSKVSSQIPQGRLCFCKTDQLYQFVFFFLDFLFCQCASSN